jgi:alkyl hydroperoxide reductase subunit AhpC
MFTVTTFMIQTFITGFLAQIGRADFVVDPKGTIRVILYYPLELGRNMTKYSE